MVFDLGLCASSKTSTYSSPASRCRPVLPFTRGNRQRFDITDQLLGYPLQLKGGYLLPVERRNTILLAMTMTWLESAIFAVMLLLSMVLLFRSRPTK